MNKAGVQEVFRQIKEQAGLNFVYDKAQVATLPPVTLTMQGVTVDAVLKRVFQGSPFEYIYENSTVVIKKRATVPQKPGEVVIRGVVSDQDGNTIPGEPRWVLRRMRTGSLRLPCLRWMAWC